MRGGVNLFLVKLLGIIPVCVLLIWKAATGLPLVRFIAICIILLLPILTIAIIEHRDKKREKKHQLDPMQAVNKEIARKFRYKYRTCISKLEINYKESWKAKANRTLDKLVSILCR